MASDPGLRILAISSTWQGATDYGFVRALRRAGHSVLVVPEADFYPAGWSNPFLKTIRRGLSPFIVAEYQSALIAHARHLKPEIFLVFKGAFVTRDTLKSIRNSGAIAINYYPDIDIRGHGPYIPRALPYYDWIFTTKSFGLADMQRQIGVTNASFIPHPYDPETHFPAELDAGDLERYVCDASFIGTWSPKKEGLVVKLRHAMPELNLKIWGDWWERASGLGGVVMRKPVFGREYAKAITASRINIAILTEARQGSSSGDRTTTRTFEIPAVGGFMLHERTAECEGFFAEGRECAMFGNGDELTAKIKYYLAHSDERERIAGAGHRRCAESGYSADAKAAVIVDKARELRAQSTASER